MHTLSESAETALGLVASGSRPGTPLLQCAQKGDCNSHGFDEGRSEQVGAITGAVLCFRSANMAFETSGK